MHRLYTTRYINAISLACTVIIFSLICFLNIQIRDMRINKLFSIRQKDLIKVQFNNSEKTNEEKEEMIKENNWKLKIPVISLEASIEEGTTEEILNTSIGHFEETSKINGNIGLAAHNRGYAVNYFADIKKLKEGDIIQYQYQNFNKDYTVVSNIIIKDTDWTKLEKTKENTITLITCIENEPEFRRCVIGKEKI